MCSRNSRVLRLRGECGPEPGTLPVGLGVLAAAMPGVPTDMVQDACSGLQGTGGGDQDGRTLVSGTKSPTAPQ